MVFNGRLRRVRLLKSLYQKARFCLHHLHRAAKYCRDIFHATQLTDAVIVGNACTDDSCTGISSGAAAEAMQEKLDAWLSSSLGQAFLASQQMHINPLIEGLFGYHLMQQSIGRRLNLCAASRIQHAFSLGPIAAGVDSPLEHIVSSLELLPLAAESIDLVLLHHVLEYSQDPHQLLREASRVIVKRGHLVVVGFNPVSFYGLYQWMLGRLLPNSHWRHHRLYLSRLKDWLRLIDFEVVSLSYGFYRPPIHHVGIMRKIMWLERLGAWVNFPFGGYYVLVARKDIIPVTPIKPSWGRSSSILGLGIGRGINRADRAKKCRIE